jgi:hypothetical protein
MNPEQDPNLERDVQRLLQDLPDFAAPPTLATRTMAALDRPSRRRRRIQPWTHWPLPAQIAFFAMAIAIIGGAAWTLGMFGPGIVATLKQHFSPVTTGFVCFWNSLRALANAAALTVESMGRGFILICCAAIVVAWVSCIGFGAAVVRYAMPRNDKNL